MFSCSGSSTYIYLTLVVLSGGSALMTNHMTDPMTGDKSGSIVDHMADPMNSCGVFFLSGFLSSIVVFFGNNHNP